MIRAHLLRTPGDTPEGIAVAIMGSGAPRSYGRRRTARILAEMEAAGILRRERPATYEAREQDRWFAL